MFRHAARRIFHVFAFLAVAPVGGAGQGPADVLLGFASGSPAASTWGRTLQASSETLWMMKRGRLCDPGGLLDGLPGAANSELQHRSKGGPNG